jgi:hypothetical protein
MIYVFFIYITAFGSANTITFEAQNQAACEQMRKAVTTGIKEHFGYTRDGRLNFTGTITECEKK